MRLLSVRILLVLCVAGAGVSLATPPVDADGRPLIKKLGTVDVDKVENYARRFSRQALPLRMVPQCRLLPFRGLSDRSDNAAVRQGWCFASAFVEGDTVYVTGTRPGKEVQMWASKDLEHWDTWTALDLPGFKIFNTSICKADGKYVLMFEISEPKEQAGVPFTARFATSSDLKHWTVTPPECVYAKDRYTAPHCLRYLDGYYYDFYLETIHGGYEQYVVRSKDLIHWESSPLNPVLRASDEDRKIRNPNLTPAAASADRHGKEHQQFGHRLLRVSGALGDLLLMGQSARGRTPGRGGL